MLGSRAGEPEETGLGLIRLGRRWPGTVSHLHSVSSVAGCAQLRPLHSLHFCFNIKSIRRSPPAVDCKILAAGRRRRGWIDTLLYRITHQLLVHRHFPDIAAALLIAPVAFRDRTQIPLPTEERVEGEDQRRERERTV